MIRVTTSLGLAAILALTLTSCSGSGGGASPTVLKESLGQTFTTSQLTSATENTFLTQYGYRFRRNVIEGDDIYIETDWKDQSAFGDEAALGVAFTRTRFIITGRPRTRSPGSIASYSGRITAETEVRMAGSDSWVGGVVTEQRKEYVTDIVTYLNDQIRQSFRN